MAGALPIEVDCVAIRALGVAGVVYGCLAVPAEARGEGDVANNGNHVFACQRAFFRREEDREKVGASEAVAAGEEVKNKGSEGQLPPAYNGGEMSASFGGKQGDAKGDAAVGAGHLRDRRFGHGSIMVSPRRGSDKRLPMATVQRIERLIGGDPVTEELVLRFISARYRATSLMQLPRHVGAEVVKRPADFVRAAKVYSQPELGF